MLILFNEFAIKSTESFILIFNEFIEGLKDLGGVEKPINCVLIDLYFVLEGMFIVHGKEDQ